MSRRHSEQETNRDQRKPVSGEIYHNNRWISVDDCQAPYSEAQQQSQPSTGHYTTDEYGRQVWSDNNEQGY